MAIGLEPKWTDLSDMLATCTDDQLLKWKEVAENPRGDNFNFITSLRQLVVHMYNKRAQDIISELYTAVNDEINSRNGDINMDKKLEARIERLEKMLSRKNEAIEMSPAEIRAKQAIENAIDALNEAEKACSAIGFDDMWSSNNWAKLGRDCEAALSYLPRPGDF